MNLEQISSNTVIVANQFNPSILREHWLIKNDVWDEDELQTDCIFTDMLVQVKAKLFDLVATPGQLQFTPKSGENDEGELVVEKLGKIVNALPHTPYQAVGLNSTWHLGVADDNVTSVSRSLFFKDDSPLYEYFDDSTAHFGAHMSKDWQGFRVKLDAIPVKIENEPNWKIQFRFNFHRSVAGEDDPATHVHEALEKWNAVKDEVSSIVHYSEKGENS